jgi:hypothetical protein
MDQVTKGAKLRHRDVIGVALRRLEQQLHSKERDEVIEEALREAGDTSRSSAKSQ